MDSTLMMSPATMRMVMPLMSYYDDMHTNDFSSTFPSDFSLSVGLDGRDHLPSHGFDSPHASWKQHEAARHHDFSLMMDGHPHSNTSSGDNSHHTLSPLSSPSLCDSEEYSSIEHDGEIFGPSLKRSSSAPSIEAQLRTPVRKRANLSLSLAAATSGSESTYRVAAGSSHEMAGMITPISAGNTPSFYRPSFMSQLPGKAPLSPPTGLSLSPGFVESTTHLATPPSSVGKSHKSSVSVSSTGNPFYCPPSFMRSRSEPLIPGHDADANTSTHEHDLTIAAAAAASAAAAVVDESAQLTCVFPDELVHSTAPCAGSEEHQHMPMHSSVLDFSAAAGPRSVPVKETKEWHHVPVATHSAACISANVAAKTISIEADSSDKPHVCSDCSKRFKRMEHLRRHAKIHTLERPYQCEVDGCKRYFSRNDNLKAHMKTHTKRTGRNIFVADLQLDEAATVTGAVAGAKRSHSDDDDNDEDSLKKCKTH